MSVFLAVALIFCMVVPSYAVVAEGILIYKGITISAAAIKTLLVWSGVTIGAVAVTGAAVDNADKIAYTASAIWDDIKQSATTAATTVKNWVSSWVDSASDADRIEYTTPVTKTWTAAEIQAVVDAFREYLSLSTTTSSTGEKILNIKTLEASYTITASKTYVQGDTVFTIQDGTQFYAFPIYNNPYTATVTDEAAAEAAMAAFVTAMTNKGIQVVKSKAKTGSGTIYADTIKIRSSEPMIWDLRTTTTSAGSDYAHTVADNIWNTSDGKKVINAIPIVFNTQTRYPTLTSKNVIGYGSAEYTTEFNDGMRVGMSTSRAYGDQYIAAVPYIAYDRTSTDASTGTQRYTSDGYASIMILSLSWYVDAYGAYQVYWNPLSVLGRRYESMQMGDVWVRQGDVSVPMDCDVTIMTETGTLVNADEVQKEVPIVGIEDGVTVPADVLTGDVSITLPTTSDVTLGDTLVNDTTTAGTLTDAGVKTDSVAIDTTTTADPSVPGGDGSGGVEFPTGVFDGIWKYVKHLVEKGSAFVGFLGDCLSCIPQEVSWCFYGGLVLLVFGAVLSKMLL